MTSHRLQNYLRTYRRKSGLTQREVAFLLGRKNGAQLSRYEKQHCLPPLRTALAFEAIYKIPLAELFAGLRESVGHDTSERIAILDADIQAGGASKSRRRLVARKRSWVAEHHRPELSPQRPSSCQQ